MEPTESPAKSSRIVANILAIVLTLTTVILAIITWRLDHPQPFDTLSVYAIFPLIGLLAFSLMWCLYTVNVATTYFEGRQSDLDLYYRITGYAVLAAILAHPLLLITQLWRDGFGLPPGSYSAYVAKGLEWVALLGTASLFIFLIYELRRWFAKRTWWKWIVYLNDVAMLAILYHSLTLGGDLQGWFRYVWFFYAVMFVIYLIYLRFYRGIWLARSAKRIS
jgi:hypothetical protein